MDIQSYNDLRTTRPRSHKLKFFKRLRITAKAVQYCGGIASVHVGDSISTAEAVQYCGGIESVLQRLFSTVEG